MEPPPLTVSKRRDPLHDGGVFQWKQEGSPVRSLIQPGPSVGVTGALVATNPLLRSAAEAAAAINRSTEAQQIKRSWEALVGSSPLPAAVRTAFSPALSQRRLAGGALGSDFRSPAASSPFLHDFHSRSSLPAPGTRLQYVMPSATHTEVLPPPSVLYRNAVQQQARQRQQQQQAAQAGAAGAGPSVGGHGVEVETSKFTRVVHSHSPGYQAVVSSTLQVVRQSSQQLQPPPSILPRATGGVILEEIPPAEPPVQQQQQQQQPYRAQPSVSHQEPVVLMQVRLLPAQRAALALPSAEQKQQAASSLAPAQAGTLHAPAGRAEDDPAQPPQAVQQAQQAEMQVQQETLAREGIPSGVAAEGRGTGSVPRPGSPSDHLGPENGGEQSSLGQVHGSVQQAMAAVGAIVSDLASPSPEPAEEPSRALVGGPAISQGQRPVADAVGNQAREVLAQQEQQQQQHEAEPGAGTQAGLGIIPAPDGAAEHAEQDAGDGGERDQEPLDLPGEGPGSQPGRIASTSARRGRSAAMAAPAQQQRWAEQPVEVEASEPAAGEAAEPLEPAAAPAASAEPQPSGGKAKPAAGKASKKRPRSAESSEGAIKRRSMQLRGDAATVQPILHSIGEAPAGIEVTRSGRPRMPPLPFWTNSRLVRNASKDVVGVERKADLLGLSGKPQKQKPAAAVGMKSEGSKAKAGPSAKPTPAKTQPAEKASKGRLGGKEKQGSAAAEQAAAKQEPAPNARANKVKAAPAAKAPARTRKQGVATSSKERAEELAAALQLQQLGRGGAAVRKPTLAASSRGKQQQQRQQPGPAANGPPTTQQPKGLAALAASAGARAAAEVAANAAAPPSQRARKAAGSFTGPAAGGSAALEGGSGPAEKPPLPVVEGVPLATMLAQSQLPPQQRSRCGQCKHCLKPASRQACLVRQALRGWDAQKTRGGAEAAQQQREQRVAESKPQPSTASGGATAKVPRQIAAGGKRTEEAAGGKSPAAKRARTQRTPQQQEQKWQQQEGEGEEQEKERGREEASAPSQGGIRSGAAEIEALQPAEVEPQQQQEEEEEEEEADEQGWTASQAAALQRAWLQINPTAANFWQLVAKQVPGKTAAECYNRHMSRHPTPPHPARKAGPKKYLAAAKEGARMPELKPGASKQAMQNAARKYSRQLQWQQKANRAQAASGSGELAPELLEEMEAAERKDRYIDQILRKRMGRPLGAAPRNRKAAASLLSLAQPGLPLAGAGGETAGQGAGVRKLMAQDSEQEVRAVLASLPQHDPEEDKDSEEGSDYYWSDA